MKIESLGCDSDFCRSKLKAKYTLGFVIPILDLLLIIVWDSDFCRSNVKAKYVSGFVIPILDLLLTILWLIWHLLSEYIVIAEGLYFHHY